MSALPSRRGRPPYPDTLTPSETRVLQLIREGKTNSEIAYELAISVPGVKYHVTNMLGKLHLSDRHELAAWQPGAAATQPRSRRWLGFLPGLKLGLGAGAVLAGGAALAVVAIALRPSGDQDAASVETADPFPMTAEMLSADERYTRLQVTMPPDVFIRLDDSLKQDLALVTDRGIDLTPTIYGFQGSLNEQFGGESWTAVLELGPLPADTRYLDVTVKPITVEAPGLPFPHRKSFGAQTIRLDVSSARVVRDLTHLAPARIDSGFGWQWVFDKITATPRELTVEYHAEGDIEGSHSFPTPSPNTAPSSQLSLRVPYNTWPQTARLTIPADATELTIRPVAASRPREGISLARFGVPHSGASAHTTVDIAGRSFPASLTLDATGVTPAWIVTVTSDLVLGHAGPGGTRAELSDGLGTRLDAWALPWSYPPAETSWRFTGAFDPAAPELVLKLDGYEVIEKSDWLITIPRN